jgi:tripartite-type tricarboxylate transporter receptor subunit TctC
MNRSIRTFIALGISALCFSAAHAQDFPNRSIKLVVGFSAGGGSDLVARIVSKTLGEKLHQAVIVENLPGAGGLLATRSVAKEKPDGYTLLLGSAAAFVINPYLQKNVGYDPVHDFTPIGAASRFDYVLLGRKGLPAANLQELIQHAKAHPQSMTIGSAGVGSNTHLVALAFMKQSGAELRHVPYKGTAGALNDIMGGNIDVLFDSVPTVSQQVISGALVGFATTGSKREHELPNVPTFAEAGLPGFEASNWFAVFGPKGMSPAVTNKLNAAIEASLKDPALLAVFEKSGNIPLAGSSADLAALVAKETRQYKKLIDDADIHLE